MYLKLRFEIAGKLRTVQRSAPQYPMFSGENPNRAGALSLRSGSLIAEALSNTNRFSANGVRSCSLLSDAIVASRPRCLDISWVQLTKTKRTSERSTLSGLVIGA